MFGGGSTACSGGCGVVFKLAPTGEETFSTASLGARAGLSLLPVWSGILRAIFTVPLSVVQAPAPSDCGVVFKLTP